MERLTEESAVFGKYIKKDSLDILLAPAPEEPQDSVFSLLLEGTDCYGERENKVETFFNYVPEYDEKSESIIRKWEASRFSADGVSWSVIPDLPYRWRDGKKRYAILTYKLGTPGLSMVFGRFPPDEFILIPQDEYSKSSVGSEVIAVHFPHKKYWEINTENPTFKLLRLCTEASNKRSESYRRVNSESSPTGQQPHADQAYARMNTPAIPIYPQPILNSNRPGPIAPPTGPYYQEVDHGHVLVNPNGPRLDPYSGVRISGPPGPKYQEVDHGYVLINPNAPRLDPYSGVRISGPPGPKLPYSMG